MSKTVITVEGLSKSYRLGETLRYQTLRDAIASGFSSMMKRPFSERWGKKGPGEHWALKDVSFSVNEGEVLGIIGRNGAGKSTLLKILSRITDPTEGTARIRGRLASLLEVGTGFHQELTGRENIFLNGAILGMTRREIRAKFDEIVAFAEIEKFLDTPVKRYSSGMYVRLAFAVAAHLEPEILIVDEVLSVGDAAFQKKCLGRMGDVSKSGRTILFVSHNMAAVQRLCTRSILLEGGQTASIGGTRKVIEKYLSSSEKTAREGALDRLPRELELGKSIKITKAQVMDSKGNLNSSILFGEPFAVYIEAAAYKEFKELSVVVGIDSSEGYRIATVLSEDSSAYFHTAASGQLRVNARFESLILKPGRYTFTIGIRSGTTGLDRVINVGRLEVIDATYNGRKISADSWGAVYTTASWTDMPISGPKGMPE